MFNLILIIFCIGYLAIALEHPLKINKAASALLTGVIIWVLIIIGAEELAKNSSILQNFINATGSETLDNFISHTIIPTYLSEIAEILFFLMGAMTIVEIIDSHDGFSVITNKIRIHNKIALIWILSFITFFLSAVLDNLTTTIVMVTLIKKLIKERYTRCYFASIIIIAANAGGAWSPIGDVTTIMLWIGGQVSAKAIILRLILPSIINILIPLLIISFIMLKSENLYIYKITDGTEEKTNIITIEKYIILFTGIFGLIFVPVFKAITHLPPYLGILLALGVLWLITEILHKYQPLEIRSKLAVSEIIKRIDTSTILFFLGILTAVSGLSAAGHLERLGKILDYKFHSYFAIDLLIGIISSIVDNVPLVAGAMKMYPIHNEASLATITEPSMREFAALFVKDGLFWEFLAYCAGTGGSILIIGSAAGVAAMGLEKIDFIWYLKKISWIAFIGYIGGALFYKIMFG